MYVSAKLQRKFLTMIWHMPHFATEFSLCVVSACARPHWRRAHKSSRILTLAAWALAWNSWPPLDQPIQGNNLALQFFLSILWTNLHYQNWWTTKSVWNNSGIAFSRTICIASLVAVNNQPESQKAVLYTPSLYCHPALCLWLWLLNTKFRFGIAFSGY